MTAPASPTPPPRPLSRWARFALVAGPGMVVMLADTDAGSIITAAQSGAQWGYHLLLLQLVLVPILFIVQELTVRLGVVSGKGHGELIREQYGTVWAWVSVGTLVIACIGALLSELSGLAGVGLLFGVPAWITMTIVVAGLTLMAYTGSYLSVERIAMAIGAFELVFLVVAWKASPDLSAMSSGALSMPWHDRSYLYLVAANIGAVIMPWMVFYQQSAVVEKRLTTEDLAAARWDTAIGAIVTQIIMACVLVATAATLGAAGRHAALDTVEQIAEAIVPFLGAGTGKVLFGLGMAGSALVATIVVTLTAARTLGEVLGLKHSLEYAPAEAPWFYGFYTVALAAGGILVASGVNLVSLSVGVQVMNALLLPIVLGFLYLLARRLAGPYRLRGVYGAVVAIVIVISAGFGVYAAIAGVAG
jgi:Mn2+/Fe2+ NRAMP family transporter